MARRHTVNTFEARMLHQVNNEPKERIDALAGGCGEMSGQNRALGATDTLLNSYCYTLDLRLYVAVVVFYYFPAK